MLRGEDAYVSSVSREGSREKCIDAMVIIAWQWFPQGSLMELLNACGSDSAVQATLGIAAELSFLPSAAAVRAKCAAAPSS